MPKSDGREHGFTVRNRQDHPVPANLPTTDLAVFIRDVALKLD